MHCYVELHVHAHAHIVRPQVNPWPFRLAVLPVEHSHDYKGACSSASIKRSLCIERLQIDKSYVTTMGTDCIAECRRRAWYTYLWHDATGIVEFSMNGSCTTPQHCCIGSEVPANIPGPPYT